MIRETRLIALINMRSGGGKGAKLARELENNGLATVFDLVQCSKPDYLDKLQKGVCANAQAIDTSSFPSN